MKQFGFLILGIVLGVIITGGGWWIFFRVEKADLAQPEVEAASQIAEPVNSFVPQPVTFTFKPSEDSLKAKVLSVNGDVTKTPADASEAASLNVDDLIEVGEPVRVGEQADLSLTIENYALASVAARTTLSLLNSQPQAILFRQNSGTTTYQNLTKNDQPIYIRSLNFLMMLTKGEIEVEIDEKQRYVTVELTAGQAAVAWENQDYESQLINLEPGVAVVFDNTKLVVD